MMRLVSYLIKNQSSYLNARPSGARSSTKICELSSHASRIELLLRFVFLNTEDRSIVRCGVMADSVRAGILCAFVQ
jgi:hypothetical protein